MPPLRVPSSNDWWHPTSITLTSCGVRNLHLDLDTADSEPESVWLHVHRMLSCIVVTSLSPVLSCVRHVVASSLSGDVIPCRHHVFHHHVGHQSSCCIGPMTTNNKSVVVRGLVVTLLWATWHLGWVCDYERGRG